MTRSTYFRIRTVSVAIVVTLLLAACSQAPVATSDVVTTTPTPSTTVPAPVTTITAVETTDSTEPPEPDPEPSAIEISIVDGEVEGGVLTLSVEVGGTVEFVVITDTVDHVHVHGYDLFYDITPEEPVEISFVANVPGVFEIELEDSHTLIVELEVS